MMFALAIIALLLFLVTAVAALLQLEDGNTAIGLIYVLTSALCFWAGYSIISKDWDTSKPGEITHSVKYKCERVE